tara:strand:+ start:705 stop:839 length:135 start_codon:yes stop_codon:yes gene_type:complete
MTNRIIKINKSFYDAIDSDELWDDKNQQIKVLLDAVNKFLSDLS